MTFLACLKKRKRSSYTPEVKAKEREENYGIPERNPTQWMKDPKLTVNIYKEELEPRLTRKWYRVWWEALRAEQGSHRQAMSVLWHGSLLVWFWVLFLLSEELAMLFIDKKKILHHHCWTEVRTLDWISGGREEWEALVIHRWKQPENIFPLAQCPWCNLPSISTSNVWLVSCISYWDRLSKLII